MRDWYLILFAAVIFASACTTPDEAERSLDTAQIYETPAQHQVTTQASPEAAPQPHVASTKVVLPHESVALN